MGLILDSQFNFIDQFAHSSASNILPVIILITVDFKIRMFSSNLLFSFNIVLTLGAP